MTRLPTTTIDPRAYAAAEDVFTSEGGRPVSPLSRTEQQLMNEFSIRYDGCHYEYTGYRYDRLTDAVAYARLDQSRLAREAASPPRPLRRHRERLAEALRGRIGSAKAGIQKQLARWSRHATHSRFLKDKA